MLDDLIKTIVKNKLSELNTTMQCKVVSVTPLVIQPIEKQKYVSGEEDYPLIGSAKVIKQLTMVGGANFTEVPTYVELPLNVGDIVMVAFGKKDLSDAVILGVV